MERRERGRERGEGGREGRGGREEKEREGEREGGREGRGGREEKEKREGSKTYCSVHIGWTFIIRVSQH